MVAVVGGGGLGGCISFSSIRSPEPQTQFGNEPVGDPFIETLDYLFFQGAMTVKDVVPLPHRDDVVGPFPNADEPSDHILIGATFTLQKK